MDCHSPTVLSLCTGAGGLELGLKLAIPGSRTVCYVEGEAYAASILAARMEDKTLDAAPVWSDVRTFDSKPWRGCVDIITAGYPCQPFSIAGRKKGEQDSRHLWPYIRDIVADLRPRIAFFENVATIYDWASNKSMMTYEAWVTALRRACLRRKKSVLRTSANDCSSWPTPRAQEPGSTSPGYRKGLSETARQWLTPRASETSERQDTFLKRMADRTDNAYGSLTTQATTWPTPLSRDWKDSPGMKKRETGQTSLAETAFQLGRQDHETSKHGDLSQLRLNPLFTEWLMGWPTGWTGSASVATAWCRWLPLMRSELLRLLSKDSHG